MVAGHRCSWGRCVTSGCPSGSSTASTRPEPRVGNRPERLACRWHLAKNLHDALVKDLSGHVAKPAEHAPHLSAERAIYSEQSWCTWRWLTYRELLRLEPAALTATCGMPAK
jgi:hypothetical protein